MKVRDIVVGPYKIDIEGKDANEIAEQMVEVEKVADGLLELGVTFQQLAIAKGLFSPAPATAAKERDVAATPQSGPPADDAPRCPHGAMLDLGDKGFKHRWYCAKKGKDKACWAKD